MKQKTEAPTANRADTSVDRVSAKRPLALVLSKAALDALEGEGGTGAKASARVETALRVYLGDRDSGRPAWAYPDFLRSEESSGGVEDELSVDSDLWRLFAAEALQQQVSVQQLAEHAALYLAAELAAGRLTQRILDDLEPGETADEKS